MITPTAPFPELNITVAVRKITDPTLMHDAFSSTVSKHVAPTLEQAYRWMHSPIRTQMFAVYMLVPTFVSVHFVRHKIGVEHFVKSNRADRGGDSHTDRNTFVQHMMLINAEALLTMAQKRLCSSADPMTRHTMRLIEKNVYAVDPDLANAMGPTCKFRGGICPEPKCCGRNGQYKQYKEADKQP